MMSLSLLKCGVRFDSPAVVVTYNDSKTDKTRRRTMPLRNFNKFSGIEHAATELLTNSRHRVYLEKIPRRQLEKLITIIHDKLNGLSLDASLKNNQEIENIDPEEDLNKVDEDILRRKKAVMNDSFEKNRKKCNDPDFVYDVDVEFEEADVAVETCGWDSDGGSDPEF